MRPALPTYLTRWTSRLLTCSEIVASYVGQVDLSIRCSAHYCSAWAHVLQLLEGSSTNLSHLDGPRIVSIPSHKRKPTGGPEVNIRRRMPRPRFEPRRGQNFYNPPNRSLHDTSTEQKSFTHNTRIKSTKKLFCSLCLHVSSLVQGPC